MAEKLNKLVIIDVDQKEYEFAGGSGSYDGSTPPPDSVGTEQLIDEGVGYDDLHPDVRAGLDELNNIELTEKDIEDVFFPNGVPNGN